MSEHFEILRRYNFWDGNKPPTGYLRSNYTTKIYNSCTGNRLIKVLVGQRRVGKSYILRQLIAKFIEDGVSAQNILFINCEFTDFSFIQNYPDLDALIKEYYTQIRPKGKVYLFIDEIQSITEWERLINSYSQDYTADYEIFISGSNSKMLSGELATLLSGRYITYEILPFGFYEYIGITNIENSKSSYEEYMQNGGLPELFHLNEMETKQNYISSIKDTVLLRDIIQRYNIKDAKLLEDIFIFIINNASNLISVHNIANYFKSIGNKCSYETVASYLRYLEDTYLIHRVERYNISGKETIAGNCKYYANDLSFNNYLYKGFNYGAGYLLENLIYLELRRHGYNIYVGSIRNKEIDFVAIKGDRTIYLQATYLLLDKLTIEREYSALESIKDNYEKIVVSLDNIKLPIKDGIHHIRAWELSDIL